MNLSIIKYILKTTVLVLVISFFTDKLIFFVLNKVSDKVFTGQAIGKLNQYLQINEELDLVVFGSSRANHSINPIKLAENSFNVGVDGTKLAYSSTLIKLLPKQKKQILLLHLDPENAFSKDYLGNDIRALSSKYNRNKIIKNEIDKLKQDNLLQNYFWSLSYNGKSLGMIKNYLKPNYNYKDYFGYDPIYVNENQKKILKNILKKNSNDTNCENEFILNDIYDITLDELNVFCKKNNKVLIIFTSPKYVDSCKDDNIKFSEILKKRNLTYFDFTDFFKENNTLDYWRDKTHLSNIGAELFTDKIKDITAEVSH
ncbi:hypothetical protein [Algibacter sp. R77976]|uniref:hypothetical protein n=1 Tax=Algibacter sp. R77976 TaxID=3093873 RepID=UPI0037CA404F